MTPKPIIIQIEDAVVKVREPANTQSATVAVMLHGWTGDENSMWVFANQLPEDWLIIAPRAPFPTLGSDLGGYSWIDRPLDTWPIFQDFLQGANWLSIQLKNFGDLYPNANLQDINLFGFSQGAAMTFVYASIHPKEIAKIGLLSGFIPDNSEGFIKAETFQSHKIFIAHGEKDEIVPLEKAEYTYKILRELGSDPKLCLSNVGHRLGAECFQSFSSFMSEG